MITREPAREMIDEWKAVWEQYKDSLRPNRKNGAELLAYLQSAYSLTEIFDKNALDAIAENVALNEVWAEKLPVGQAPVPRAFFLENAGNGRKFYLDQNRDSPDVWGDDITLIFVGVELSSGFYMVEGSSMLWDELCAFQGVDENDLNNFVIVAQYISALKRFGKI